MGNKFTHLDLINDLINKSNKEYYIEPFLGSAQIIINLKKNFKNYYLAEIDPNLLNIFNQLLFNTKENEFTEYVKKVKYKFNVNEYNGYYSFREYFNNNLWKTQTKEECFALLILTNNCINSMYRFGNNGFNASYGSGHISDYKCNNFELSLKKLKALSNRIYLTDNAFNIMHKKDSLYILDPPYTINEMANSNGWNKDHLENMFLQLDFDSNDIIYFDIENDIGNKYFTNKIYLDKIKNISPARKEEKRLNEVCYYKIGEIFNDKTN